MKSLVISGGSYGIGQATIARFSQAGYFCFNLDQQQPEKQFPNTQFIECDITNLEAIKDGIKIITQQTATIDALVSNAGVHYSATLLETELEAYNRIININFRGAFFLSQGVLPFMLEQKKGTIVYVGSEQTLVAKPHSAIYGASKAALGSLARFNGARLRGL